MSTATNSPKSVANELGNQANQLLDKAKDTAADAVNKTKQAAAGVGQSASRMASDATTAVAGGMRSFGEAIKEHAPSEGLLGQASKSVACSLEQGGKYLEKEGLGGLASDVGDVIKRNPLPAIFIGIGLGFLIGRSLRK